MKIKIPEQVITMPEDGYFRIRFETLTDNEKTMDEQTEAVVAPAVEEVVATPEVSAEAPVSAEPEVAAE